jgi:hypothetical protein
METPHDGNMAKDVHKRSPDNKPRVDFQLSKGDLSEHQNLTDPIAGVTSQIIEVAESIKLVQKQVIEVGSKIEATKNELNQANLPNEKKDILVMELKNLMDEKKSLMDEKKSLMDKEGRLMDKEGRLMDEKKSLMDEKKGHQKHSDGWWEWWKSNLNKVLAGAVPILAIIGGLATFNKETDRSLENIYNNFSSSLANAKFDYVNSPNYVARPTIESEILNVYNNKDIEKGAYYIVYGVKGAGKTSAVKHVLGNKSGVVLVRISENDTNETIIKKIFAKCGVTLKEDADVGKIVDSMGDAMVKRNGHPITIVFEVERGSSSPQILSIIKHISKDFALAANVLIVLSEANAILGFGEDKRQKFILVDQMTREEAEQFVKKLAPNISSNDFNKFADLCGTIPLVLRDFCDDFLQGLTVDECIANVVDSARGDLVAFIHKPILSALKKSPGGVSIDAFNNVENDGVLLSSPKLVAPAMKISNAIYYDFKARRYKLFSKAHETALKNYDPSEIPKTSR